MPIDSTWLVTGHIRLTQPINDDLLGKLSHAQATARGEPGCISYRFSLDLDDAARINVTEIWTDRSLFETHIADPQSQKLFAEVQRFGIDELEINTFEATQIKQD